MNRTLPRVLLIFAVAVVAMAGMSLATAHSAAAQFGCFGTEETFDQGGAPSVPGTWSLVSGNWTVTEDDASYSYVYWHRSDQSPTYGASQGAPISGLHAYAESYPAYCGYSYDTSLVSPSFATTGMREVIARFAYQYWVYSSEFLHLDYRIGSGSWVTAENLASNGGYAPAWKNVDMTAARGQGSVQIRFRYANLGSGCDWWTNVDNVSMVCAVDAAAVEELPVAMPDPSSACINGVAEFQISVTNTGTAALADRPGQPEFTVSFSGTGGGALSVRGIASGAGAGQIPGSAPLGGMASADLSIPVGGTDIVTVRVGFAGGLGSVGDIYVYRAVWVDFTNFGVVDASIGELNEFEDEEPFVIDLERAGGGATGFEQEDA